MAATRAVAASPLVDRLAGFADRLLRVVGDGRTGLALLAATALANGVAALLPAGQNLLDGLPYALLLGALALSAVATVAVRAPAAWREWRRPGTVAPGSGALEAVIAPAEPDDLASRVAAAGYRVRIERARGRWAVHGVRRGWSRFAGIASHLALVLIVLGAALGSAFGSETVFSLLPGDQALLDAPRPGFNAAVRLDALDAEFGPDGRPLRLDTRVTFVRDGSAVAERTLRVNEPGDFEGYLVHPWTYGPAAVLRVTTLEGTALLDAPVPLDATSSGAPAGSTVLPTESVTLGLTLANDDANELGVSAVDGTGRAETARLRPGESRRVGDVVVELERLDAWVTFMSRRDPGLLVLFLGAGLLSVALAVAFWLPRRRVTIRSRGADVVLILRGERFDRPTDELAQLTALLAATA